MLKTDYEALRGFWTLQLHQEIPCSRSYVFLDLKLMLCTELASIANLRTPFLTPD